MRDGYGSDASLFSLRIQGLAGYQHELLRGKKKNKFAINVKFSSGGMTMVKRKGLLFSLLYFMAEFWLTSQQVLRIGKW